LLVWVVLWGVSGLAAEVSGEVAWCGLGGALPGAGYGSGFWLFLFILSLSGILVAVFGGRERAGVTCGV
jgi:hypothetical protein